MRTYLRVLTWLTVLACLPLPSASADCAAQYEAALVEKAGDARSDLAMSGLTGASSVVMLSSPIGLAYGAAFGLVASYSSSRMSTLSLQRKNLERALSVIQQAQLGDGVELRKFQKKVSDYLRAEVSLEDVASSIASSEVREQLCPADGPLGYPQLVQLIGMVIQTERQSAF